MNIFIRFTVVIFFLGLTTATSAQQNPGTKNKKAAEYFIQADNFRVRNQFEEALEYLRMAIDKDDEYYDAYLMMGLIQKAQGDLFDARQNLEKLLELPRDNQAPAYFELADLYIQIEEYDKALDMANRFLALKPGNQRRKQEAEQYVKNATFAIENSARMSEFKPRPLPAEVNYYPMQYFPVITIDGNGLIYTRRLGVSMDFDEDLVISKKNANGEWMEPEALSENINSSGNEGTCTLSADGRSLIFTSCYGRQVYGSCDLFITYKTGDTWSEPENLGEVVNSSSWESQPSLSADGRTLYFVSNRPGGVGNRDIWVTSRNENDEWTKPVNMGKDINTRYEDISPFIHPNNVTLYYASNGRTGFGGYDIYYTQRKGNQWEEVQNFGAPVNTGEDQVSLFISADGRKGYYSLEDQSDLNIKSKLYEFDIPEDMQVAARISYVTGVITDVETGEPLKADIELFDIISDERVALVSSDAENGRYLIVLTEGSEYALYVNEEGYLFNSASFNMDRDSTASMEKLAPIVRDIALTPIREGSVSILNNIFFDTDKYALKDKSTTELDKVVRFLKQNPDVRIEISGHTDNVGTPSYNLELSSKRAEAVYNYLVSKGIDTQRLAAKGYGQTAPAYPNDTEENRRRNRRIAFRIL
jgi:outer membrane protein OmpA-like peptidoglycan-associated protein